MSNLSVSTPETASSKTLRWWPAAILVVLILALPYVPRLLESPGLPLMMASFMGPGLLGIVVLLWWLLASRASLKEKLIGLVVVLTVAFVSILLCHPSMTGMGIIISVVPTGALAFAMPLVLLARHPQLRLPVALLCCGITFGFWDLVRFEGVDGRFNGEFSWRWSPTAESHHLESLAKRNQAGAPIPDAPPITLASAQWPSFRGPHRDGRQPGPKLAEDWSSAPPKKIWSTTIGPGWSSFSVAGKRLFTQEQRGEQEAVVCLDADTGEIVWSYEYESRFWESVAGAGPRATPTIADEGLFTLGGNGVLLCLDPNKGEMKWRQDLKLDANRNPPMWGFAASPLVVNGKVVVHAGGEDDKGVLAYDVSTGELRWSVGSGDHSYSSPQLATFESVTGILMETNTGLQFLDPTDGHVVWEHSWPVKNYRALQPLVIGNSIYLAATLGDGTRKLSVSRDGDKWQAKEDWTSLELKPDFNDFVEHKGFLYGFDGSILACTDAATGKRKWKKGRYGNGQVVLLPDADQLLVSSEKGDLVLLRTDEERLVELAKIHAIDGKTWNHPVLIGDRVYIRNDQNAACYQMPIQ